MIAQLPALSPETWAAIAAALGAIAVAAKKLINRRKAANDTVVSRTEFHKELTAIRDRIGASYLAVADKLDTNHKELLSALDRQVTRINDLETAVARVDERTKTL